VEPAARSAPAASDVVRCACVRDPSASQHAPAPPAVDEKFVVYHNFPVYHNLLGYSDFVVIE